ncbi:MAG: acyl-CoA dehydrogenase family protein [Geminicoccaceae bacterium]
MRRTGSPSGPRRHDDDPLPHQSGGKGLQGPVHAAGPQATRNGRKSLPGRRPERQRDRRARLSRHEGICAVLRRLRGAGGESFWAACRVRASQPWPPRKRAHPDRRPCVGVASCAFDLGLAYAHDRKQFNAELFSFPRVSQKLAWMATETMIARQLTLHAARQKDSDRRCDLEAGLAKLLGAQVAFAAADNALQIHGGNGYAQEYPISRVLCDARILNIFEGAAEIQAQVIARRLLSGAN